MAKKKVTTNDYDKAEEIIRKHFKLFPSITNFYLGQESEFIISKAVKHRDCPNCRCK